MADKTARICELNDQFRRTFAGGRVMMTASVTGLPSHVTQSAIAKVKSFDVFTTDNDPWGEHDFGSFELEGHTFLFKIDYHR